MKTLLLRGSFVAALLIALLAPAALAQSTPVGQWRTIDDESGEPKSIVEIYEENGKLFGKVVEVLAASPKAQRNDEGQVICTTCEGERKNQPVEGLVIIKNMEQDGDEWEDGTIFNPEDGKTYKAKMSLQNEDTLDVRGFVGFSFLGRTQTWHRVTDEAAATSNS